MTYRSGNADRVDQAHDDQDIPRASAEVDVLAGVDSSVATSMFMSRP